MTIANLQEGESFRMPGRNEAFTILRFVQSEDEDGYRDELLAEVKTPDGRRVIWKARKPIAEGPVFPGQLFLF